MQKNISRFSQVHSGTVVDEQQENNASAPVANKRSSKRVSTRASRSSATAVSATVMSETEEPVGENGGKLKSRSCLIATQSKLHSSLLPEDVDESSIELGKYIEF